MSERSVFRVSNSRTQAAQMTDGLQSGGFPNDDSPTLFSKRARSNDFAHENHPNSAGVANTGTGTGRRLGGTRGWLAGIGRLLSGAVVGAAVGGIAGAVLGMGIPEYEAKRYEGKVGPLIAAGRHIAAALSGAAVGAAVGGIVGARAEGH